MARYIFLRIAWMKHYKGVKNDTPIGAGSYVAEHKDGGEVNNFRAIGAYYYGFAQIKKSHNLRIERLGAGKRDDYIDGITVILFARHPKAGGQYIVGCYRNARLFREIQRSTTGKPYIVKASVEKAFLLPEEDRTFFVEGPGETNAWYVEEYESQTYLDELENYIRSPYKYIDEKKRAYKIGRGLQQDIEKRKRVEERAMTIVAEYYGARDYNVEYKHKENLGWDLEAVLGKEKLLLEVKGLSGDFASVDFTPNEYTSSNIYRDDYRICVVANALDDKPSLFLFRYEAGGWTTKDGKRLRIQPIMSARFHLEN